LEIALLSRQIEDLKVGFVPKDGGIRGQARVAQIHRTCRKKGGTIRKTADCVILRKLRKP